LCTNQRSQHRVAHNPKHRSKSPATRPTVPAVRPSQRVRGLGQRQLWHRVLVHRRQLQPWTAGAGGTGATAPRLHLPPVCWGRPCQSCRSRKGPV